MLPSESIITLFFSYYSPPSGVTLLPIVKSKNTLHAFDYLR
jgi:hypothetical protein